jgi:hypothetical protein
MRHKIPTFCTDIRDYNDIMVFFNRCTVHSEDSLSITHQQMHYYIIYYLKSV